MATKHWTGAAAAVAQVAAGSIDSVDGTPANNTFTVTIGGVAVSVVGDTDVDTTTAALVAALEASTHPYFAAISWADGGSGAITATADVAGCPFTAALSVSGGGTGSVTDFSDTTACTGPNFWSEAENWSDGAVPVDNDSVYIAGNATPICWGLDQSAVELTDLFVEQSYEGTIGHHFAQFATSADGATVDTTVPEYRDTYLTIGFDVLEIGRHDGPQIPNGSGRIKIYNEENAASATTVHDTAVVSTDANKPCVRLKYANSSADVEVRAAPGGVAIAADEPNETATVGDVTVAAEGEGTRVFVGPGTTISNFTQQGGRNRLASAGAVTAIQVEGGVLELAGDQLMTTVTVNGGTVYPNNVPSSGAAITTLNINGGTVDTRQATAARTFTTVNLDDGTFIADDDVVTVTTFDQPAGLVAATVSRA